MITGILIFTLGTPDMRFFGYILMAVPNSGISFPVFSNASMFPDAIGTVISIYVACLDASPILFLIVKSVYDTEMFSFNTIFFVVCGIMVMNCLLMAFFVLNETSDK